jgi:hypothetical protein
MRDIIDHDAAKQYCAFDLGIGADEQFVAPALARRRGFARVLAARDGSRTIVGMASHGCDRLVVPPLI